MTDTAIVRGAASRIAVHRTAGVTLRLLDPDRQAVPAGATVEIEQLRHRFLFGCNTYSWGRCGSPEDDRIYAGRFSDLFNYATLPFYWRPSPMYPQVEPYEGGEGLTREDAMGELADWCAQHGITMKGHPLVFFREPAWIAERPPEEMEDRLWRRIAREVAAFAGTIDMWDVVNEPTNVLRDAADNGGMASLHLYRRYGPIEVIKRAFALARSANPRATLILNECDTSDRFLEIIARSLDAGAQIDAIGLQMHELQRYAGAEEIWTLCERFSRFGLPLHLTELMLPSGDRALREAFDWVASPGWVTTDEGEERQAAEVTELYRVLFSHPSVAAITWWDFSDRGACLDIPTGLSRRDLTPKPAYHALIELIKKEWWTRTEATVGSAGEARVDGFLGLYQIRVQADGQRSYRGTFELAAAGHEPIEVLLEPDRARQEGEHM